jgi:hypothetical protein
MDGNKEHQSSWMVIKDTSLHGWKSRTPFFMDGNQGHQSSWMVIKNTSLHGCEDASPGKWQVMF